MLMNPIGNDECGNGETTPNTTESEPTRLTYEAREVGMISDCNYTRIPNGAFAVGYPIAHTFCPLHPQP
eukprot:6862474-Karenia_brevis.AAC.1